MKSWLFAVTFLFFVFSQTSLANSISPTALRKCIAGAKALGLKWDKVTHDVSHMGFAFALSRDDGPGQGRMRYMPVYACYSNGNGAELDYN